MRKKRLLLSTVFFCFLLNGCGGNQASSEIESKEKQQTETEQKEIKNEQKEPSKQENEEKGNLEAEETEQVVKSATPQYRLNPANSSVNPISNANAKVVLLTFDDAPDKYSLQIAKTLKSHNVNAIFFVNGHFIDSEEEKAVLKQIHEMGFAIGNHTQSHATLKDLSEPEQKNEIVKLNDAVEAIIGERPKFFRAPFGMNTDFSKKLATEEKMLVMNWTYGYDWEKEYQTKEALTQIMVNSPYLINGANLLMHDREWTSEAISGIITGLQAKGYEMLDPKLIETP
ncbi:polysaccharide deacetylase family protein [Bacillus sp. V59.32b]|uniref:polysaccharide deacetylase family protein n=1 Tax=Bacillus sp. V59.32b TaxID=1758642 RepID=UPI0020B119B9|nr:polysaccharide deacetylase family protein [Bacillus sp. V59.32b]